MLLRAPARTWGCRPLQELHPCGAETIFMDAEYLAEIVQGLLRVHVRHALGLKGVGEKGACNAFATVAVGPGAGAAQSHPRHLLLCMHRLLPLQPARGRGCQACP